MIIYNTTFDIDKDILHDSLTYLKKVYIPEAINSGLLTLPCLRRIMHVSEEGENFAVQFHVKDITTLNYWLNNEGSIINQGLIKRFGDKITGFTTLMEEIDWNND